MADAKSRLCLNLKDNYINSMYVHVYYFVLHQYYVSSCSNLEAENFSLKNWLDMTIMDAHERILKYMAAIHKIVARL